MANSLDWKHSEDKRDIVHIVVQALVEGKLVSLPAETAYHVVASALNADAVQRLAALQDQGKVGSPTLFLRSAEEALDYSPAMSRVARRAVYRGWPGPIVLELPANRSLSVESETMAMSADKSGLAFRLPPECRARLLHERFVALRVAAHQAIVEAMRLMPGPLIAAPCIDRSGQAICAGLRAKEHLDLDVALLIDDGETHYGGLAKRVRVDENRCTLIQPGVLGQEVVDQLFHLVILLVCTGNTCRSPMAEVMLIRLLKDAFPMQMKSKRSLVHIASAGLSAFPGGSASPQAQNVMAQRGLNLQAHQSRSLTERALRTADLVLTMTGAHRSAIIDLMPQMDEKVHCLSGGNEDVSDPFGGPDSVYAACADQIEHFLKLWVDRMDESWFPMWQPEVS